MKKIFFTKMLCLLSTVLVIAQEPNFDLNRLLKANNLDAVRNEVKTFLQNYRGTPLALYLNSVVEMDAEKAVEQYKRIILQFPKSEYADDASFKVAQFYFAQGLYISARRHFLNLVENYSGSPFLDDSKYFATACLYALQKFDSCQSELRNLLFNYPNSPFAKLAKEDLIEINRNRNLERIDPKAVKHKSGGKFTLQIGAFSQINNALNQREYFSKLGLPVEIHEKTKDGGTLYLLWIGSFDTKAAAKAFGKTFKKDYGKIYRIAKRTP